MYKMQLSPQYLRKWDGIEVLLGCVLGHSDVLKYISYTTSNVRTGPNCTKMRQNNHSTLTVCNFRFRFKPLKTKFAEAKSYYLMLGSSGGLLRTTRTTANVI